MFTKQQCLVVLLVSFTPIVELHADTLSRLADVSQTDTTAEEYRVSYPEPTDSAAVTAPSWWEVVADNASYAHWSTGYTPLSYPHDDAVEVDFEGLMGYSTPSTVYSINGSNNPFQRQIPTSEAAGGGTGPSSDAPETGTFLMVLVALACGSTLNKARRQFRV